VNIENIIAQATEGVLASMSVVRRAQGKKASDIETKEDETIVTATDRISAAAAAQYLKVTNIPIMSEDSEQNVCVAGYRQFFDPLDGTSVFAGGSVASTVIWSLYDVGRRQIIASIVGEPVSGRLWTASEGKPTELRWFNEKGIPKEGGQTTVVEKCCLSRKTAILFDLSHGFTRAGRQILTDAQVGKLFSLLNTRTKINIPGSNGHIQALVANGGTGIVGSITTALGGPWDACGVLLVLQAGGHAKAFALNNGLLEEKNPLAVEDYDCLITGNSKETVNTLVDCFRQAVQ